MTNFKTSGIVTKTIQYGETSVISSIYTELFGMQQYMVKGVRSSGKKKMAKANYFQPGAILDLIVYHNPTKDLQYIADYQWKHLYKNVFFDVVKNAVATYCVETMQLYLNEPEQNTDLYMSLEHLFCLLDQCEERTTANLPIHFTLYLLQQLGFQFQGTAVDGEVLNLKDGQFSTVLPEHGYYLQGENAARIYHLGLSEWMDVKMNGKVRNELLKALQVYMQLHISEYKKIKSLDILQTIIS